MGSRTRTRILGTRLNRIAASAADDRGDNLLGASAGRTHTSSSLEKVASYDRGDDLHGTPVGRSPTSKTPLGTSLERIASYDQGDNLPGTPVGGTPSSTRPLGTSLERISSYDQGEDSPDINSGMSPDHVQTSSGTYHSDRTRPTKDPLHNSAERWGTGLYNTDMGYMGNENGDADSHKSKGSSRHLHGMQKNRKRGMSRSYSSDGALNSGSDDRHDDHRWGTGLYDKELGYDAFSNSHNSEQNLAESHATKYNRASGVSNGRSNDYISQTIPDKNRDQRWGTGLFDKDMGYTGSRREHSYLNEVQNPQNGPNDVDSDQRWGTGLFDKDMGYTGNMRMRGDSHSGEDQTSQQGLQDGSRDQRWGTGLYEKDMGYIGSRHNYAHTHEDQTSPNRPENINSDQRWGTGLYDKDMGYVRGRPDYSGSPSPQESRLQSDQQPLHNGDQRWGTQRYDKDMGYTSNRAHYADPGNTNRNSPQGVGSDKKPGARRGHSEDHRLQDEFQQWGNGLQDKGKHSTSNEYSKTHAAQSSDIDRIPQDRSSALSDNPPLLTSDQRWGTGRYDKDMGYTSNSAHSPDTGQKRTKSGGSSAMEPKLSDDHPRHDSNQRSGAGLYDKDLGSMSNSGHSPDSGKNKNIVSRESSGMESSIRPELSDDHPRHDSNQRWGAGLYDEDIGSMNNSGHSPDSGKNKNSESGESFDTESSIRPELSDDHPRHDSNQRWGAGLYDEAIGSMSNRGHSLDLGKVNTKSGGSSGMESSIRPELSDDHPRHDSNQRWGAGLYDEAIGSMSSSGDSPDSSKRDPESRGSSGMESSIRPVLSDDHPRHDSNQRWGTEFYDKAMGLVGNRDSKPDSDERNGRPGQSTDVDYDSGPANNKAYYKDKLEHNRADNTNPKEQ